ncbi:MAG: CHAT domain-containing protein [Saprospiraceae bacterium]|nr:CHAT domain-containing protein [Candidatus Vicinibacter affinis]MBK7302572.1 CHAT domain-containing protein [Candidatus Vicinibacter affinis]MBK7798501.1 CHAT domain-containing protein [Candidatus Vicinibacter affinis]MBK9641631.1 CHAT domain-containing protein [Candidatus Vicinibacter affinis]MBP6521831.1 CHAT domain-containing protein [Saprospiraceae bacterium]
MKKLICLFGFLLNFASIISAQVSDSIIIKQIDSLINISNEFTTLKDFEKALEVNSVAENIAIKNLGPESASYGRCCFMKGRINYYMGNYKEAEKWILASLDITEKNFSKKSLNYLNYALSLATLYEKIGKYKKAESIYLEIITLHDSLSGSENDDFIETTFRLGKLYHSMGEFMKSDTLETKAKKYWEAKYGKLHRYYIKAVTSLGYLYTEMERYEDAELLSLEALSLKEKTEGKRTQSYGWSLVNVGLLYRSMGRLDDAEKFYKEAQFVFEICVGKEDVDYGKATANLGIVYSEKGHYDLAELYFTKSLAIFEKAYGTEHPITTYAHSVIASLYERMGLLERSKNYRLRIQTQNIKNLGVSHKDVAKIYFDIGRVYRSMGNLDSAKYYLDLAIPIFEKSLGKKSIEYAKCLTNLSFIFSLKSDTLTSQKLLLEAKQIFESHPLGCSDCYFSTLLTLGKNFQFQNKFDLAENYFVEANLFLERELRDYNEHYPELLLALANLEIAKDSIHMAVPFLQKLILVMKGKLELATRHMSDFELNSFLRIISSHNDALYSFLTDFPDASLIQSAYDYTLFIKGYLLHNALRLKSLAQSDSTTAGLYERYLYCNRMLARDYANPYKQRNNTNEWEMKSDSIEKKLARIFVEHTDAIRQINVQEIQQKLEADEVAVEFITFQYSGNKSSETNMYAALLLNISDTTPHFILLCEEKEIYQLLNSFSARKMDYVANLYQPADGRGALPINENSKSLYDLIWKPLEPYLKGVKTTYFSPSGLLHRINQNAILISKEIDNHTLLSDKYNLVQLGSTRQIVFKNFDENLKPISASIYGGINFEMDSMEMMEHLPIRDSSIASLRSEHTFYYIDSTVRGGSWQYLLGSDQETTEINKIFSKAKIKSNLYNGNDATEESFKQLGDYKNVSPRILHISTHGFFFPDPKSENSNSPFSMSSQEPIFKISEHPMMRSGLILAGGNHAWKTGKPIRPDMEDGILTAYEICQLNLRNTELVVLSACETGLGDLQGNEGVYGLQRAFKIAGAKNLIMSLWQVPDQQTKELMTLFYKYWLLKKKTIRQALQMAQRELRNKGLEPFYWAGFVLVE